MLVGLEEIITDKNKSQKHKWNIEEFLDSARDHIGRILDNTSSRDLIYIATFSMGVWSTYNQIMRIKGRIDVVLENPLVLIPLLGPIFSGFKITDPRQRLESLIHEEEKVEIDYEILASAMLITYGLMKIDIGDVASGLTKISTAIAA